MEKLILNEEKLNLDVTCNKIEEIIEDTEMDLYTMPNRISDEYVLNELMRRTSLRFNNLQKCIKKPYFARIDFSEDGQSNLECCYLSKVGVVDYDGNLVTVDWRAPIASLYYDSNIGSVKYLAPGGEISGYLSLKRQFTIENKTLIEYMDVDAVSDDELLKSYLGVNSDSRLKNIVASIQKEQNTIIRSNLYDNIIIQGAAGSGKTTVALHRVAYLVYNFRDKYKSNQFMVIGPNKYFLSYISSVLPDLDVDNVNQLIFDEISKEYVDEKYKIVDLRFNDIKKLKCSLEFKDALEKYFSEYEKNILPEEDLKIKEFVVLKYEEIKEVYESENVTSYDNIQSKFDKLILFLKRIISDREEEIYNRLIKEYDPLKSNNAGEMYKKREVIKDELLKGCRNSFKKYFSMANHKVLQIYKNFIKNIGKYIKLEDETIDRINDIKSDSIEFEDLPAIMYIKYRLYGSKDYNKYRHVVIDEAQDLGPFHFFVLKKIFKEASFSIFGDLAQSIYPHRSIESWDEVVEDIFMNNCKILKLKKSYRTTIEIMNKANLITQHLGFDAAEPVIRHGEDVRFFCVSKDEKMDKIKNMINEMKADAYKTIAIICKTSDEVDEIYNKLHKDGIDVHNIEKESEEFESGICILTCFMAKGLEFDGVIITDASESNYKIDDKLEMKLLYVSMTRPLHKLVILYNDKITEVLS